MPSYDEKANNLFEYYEQLGGFFLGKGGFLGQVILEAVSSLRKSFKRDGQSFRHAMQSLKEVELLIEKADMRFSYPNMPKRAGDDLYLFQESRHRAENEWLA